MGNVRVWLNSDPSVWTARGYRVDGDRVVCADLADARRVVREALPDAAEIVEIASSDTIYCYRSQEHADNDHDGTSADAMIELPSAPMQ